MHLTQEQLEATQQLDKENATDRSGNSPHHVREPEGNPEEDGIRHLLCLVPGLHPPDEVDCHNDGYDNNQCDCTSIHAKHFHPPTET